MILNVNANQFTQNNPALNSQQQIPQIFPQQIPQVIPQISIPVISGAKQTNVVTLSKLPNELV